MKGKSNKNWLVLVLLSFFLGAIGVDRFYAGRIGLGILKLLVGWTIIWPLVDFILALLGRMRDRDGLRSQP